jgi:DNA-binding response OmpR family regulator
MIRIFAKLLCTYWNQRVSAFTGWTMVAVIHTVHEARPDMVLLDVQLGDADGRDICRELKHESKTQEIPVIMISASHGWDALHEKQCEPDDFLA